MENTQIRLSTDQYKQLCEYSRKIGKTVDEAIYEAVADWIAMPEAEKQEIIGKQNQ